MTHITKPDGTPYKPGDKYLGDITKLERLIDAPASEQTPPLEAGELFVVVDSSDSYMLSPEGDVVEFIKDKDDYDVSHNPRFSSIHGAGRWSYYNCTRLARLPKEEQKKSTKSMPITDSKDILAELQKYGYKAHGKKCRVVLDDPDNAPVEAIIHCKDVPTDELMCWYFCQDECAGASTYADDKHGKEYAWCFWGDSWSAKGVYSFEWVDEKDEKPASKKSEMKLIQPAIYEQDGVQYQDGEIYLFAEDTSFKAEKMRYTPEELKTHVKKCRTALDRYKRAKDKGII